MGSNDIFLIVIDALRADRIGYLHDTGLTPNIDTLANDGAVYRNCFSCVNATDSSISTILTGQYPTRHGILHQGVGVTEKEQTQISSTEPAPELLSETHFSVGIDSLERWHTRGFDRYINPRNSLNREWKVGKQIAKKMLSHSPKRLSEFVKSKAVKSGLKTESKQPTGVRINDYIPDKAWNTPRDLFLFLHYWDSHIPYVPIDEIPPDMPIPEYGTNKPLAECFQHIKGSEWQTRLSNNLVKQYDTANEVKLGYDAGIWKADKAVGDLISRLKRHDKYQNATIIVTADHGENLTEHGILFDHHGLYDETVQVPLVIKSPDFNADSDALVQHFDLLPTILKLASINYSEEEFDGKPLQDVQQWRETRNAVAAEEAHTNRRRMIRTKTWKYIKTIQNSNTCEYCGIEHSDSEELYNLIEDGEETNNIAERREDKCEELGESLEEFIDELRGPVSGKDTYETSDAVLQHLDDMGYL